MGQRRPAHALGWILLGLLVGAAVGFAAGLLRGPDRQDVSGTREHEASQWGAA